MKTYEKTSVITCTVEDLFDFHRDLNNLQAITPKDTKVKLLSKSLHLNQGDIIKIHTVKNFIPMIWEVQIQELTSPNLLVDIALKSPFSFWKHSHVFTDMGNGFCELRDKVEYRLPLGFIGNAFNSFVEYELKKMFIYRHDITRTILQEKL